MADQLQSWTDGQARTQILEFVRSVTEPGASFVPVPERVAAFDNDGTLWCEKPMCPQADFLLRRWKEMAQAHPGLARKQPWKAVTEGDQTWLARILDHVPELTRGVAEAYQGITVEVFERAVRAFFDTARHPVLAVPYTRLAYQPMRELIDLLTAAEFEVYICSAGSRDFARVVAAEMYGIPRQRRDRLGHRPGVPARSRCTAPGASSSRSTMARASRSISGPAPGAGRCWRPGTPTATPRCCGRPGSAC